MALPQVNINKHRKHEKNSQLKISSLWGKADTFISYKGMQILDITSDSDYFTVSMIDIEKVKPEIERVCRRLPVKRLGIFGSAVSRDFSRTSDVDILVIFDSGENIDLFDSYFSLKEQLEEIFKREVDLIVDRKFRNPVLRESIDKTRVVIYEQ